MGKRERLRSAGKLIIAGAFGILSSISFVQAQPSVPSHVFNVRVPERLFHWTSPQRLDELLARMKNPNELPLKPIVVKPDGTTDAIAVSRPAFQGRNALFTWSDPFTGMGASRVEFYAKATPPRVLMLKPRKDAQALVLISRLTGNMTLDPLHDSPAPRFPWTPDWG